RREKFATGYENRCLPRQVGSSLSGRFCFAHVVAPPEAGEIMIRRVLAVLAFSALVIGLTARGQPPAANIPPAKGSDASADNIVRTTDRSAQEYKKFEEALLRLAQRMDRSPRTEEKAKAEALRKAINLANKEQVENRFQKLVTLLVGNKELTTDELLAAAAQN